MFDIDTGDSGNGGTTGPWVHWKAKGSNDGIVPPRSFALRDEGGLEEFVGFKAKPQDPHGKTRVVVLDIPNMKTGYCHSAYQKGVAPEWILGESIARLPAKPQDGRDWKLGFQLPICFIDDLGQPRRAMWEDASVAAWDGLMKNLGPALKTGMPQNEGKLPVVRLVGAEAVQYGKNGTVVPKLQIVGWCDRPDVLDAEAAGQGAGQAAAPAAPARPTHAVAGSDAAPARPSPGALAAAAAAQAPAGHAAPPADGGAPSTGAFIDDEIPF